MNNNKVTLYFVVLVSVIVAIATSSFLAGRMTATVTQDHNRLAALSALAEARAEAAIREMYAERRIIPYLCDLGQFQLAERLRRGLHAPVQELVEELKQPAPPPLR